MKLKIRNTKYLFFITFLFWTQWIFSQCPTTNNVQQIFCNLEIASVASLQATDNGSGIAWFSSPTSNEPLDNSELLVNGGTYYLDNASGNCGNRILVQVTILGAPLGPNFQGFCVQQGWNVLVQDLAAFGVGIQWFATSTDLTPLPPETVLIPNSIYFASQTNPQSGCLTSRLAVFVTIGNIEDPVGEIVQTFCVIDENNPPTVSDLVVSGENNWYSSNTSLVPLSPNTVLVNNQTYFVSTVTPPCESTFRLPVTVILNEANNAGLDNIVEYCTPDLNPNESINLFDLLNGDPNLGGVWQGSLTTTGGSLGTVLNSSLIPENSPYIFTYTVSNNVECPIDSAQVTINVFEIANAGISGSVTVCSNDGLIDLFEILGGNPTSGGQWNPTLASGNSLFNPSVDPSGVYTYQVGLDNPCPEVSSTVEVTVNLNPDTGESTEITICEEQPPFDLRVLLGNGAQMGGTWSPQLQSGTDIFNPQFDLPGVYTYSIVGIEPCEDSQSTVNVIIESAPNAGNDAIAQICSNDGLVDLFNFLGPDAQVGGTWMPSLISGTGIFDPLLDTAGIYTYFIESENSCENAAANIEVIIEISPDAGISNSVFFCEAAQPFNLFDFLIGSPDTNGTWSPALPNGIFDPMVNPPGVYTYTVSGGMACNDVSANITVILEENPNAGEDGEVVLCSNEGLVNLFDFLGGNPQIGGTWTPALSSGSSIFNTLVDLPGVYVYTLQGPQGCLNASASVTVNVIPNLSAGEDGIALICDNQPTVDLFNFLEGNPQSGGFWTPSLSSGTGIFNPSVDLAGIYTYSTTNNEPCENDSATVQVIINSSPNAGISTTINICQDSTLDIDLFSLLGNNVTPGGIWSPNLASGTNIFNPQLDGPGVFIYTVENQNCSDNASITVVFDTSANAGEDTTINYCSDTAPFNLLLNIAGNPQSGGVWSPALSSGTNIFNPQIDPQGAYLYTVSGSQNCSEDSVTVTLQLIESPNAGNSTNISFCITDAPINLFTLLGPEAQLGGIWAPSFSNNSGIFDPSINASGIYTYTIPGTQFCEGSSAEVTVIVDQIPSAGQSNSVSICQNDGPIDLFLLLGPNADMGGSWSPPLNSGTGIFNPSVDNQGEYTYTISNSCGSSSASMNVTFENNISAGINGSLLICSNGPVTNLFDLLGGNPTPGGTWSPALPSSSGTFNPSFNAAGVYTYTVTDDANCGTLTANVTVTIQQPISAGNSSSLTICQNTPSLNLFFFLGSTATPGGTWSPPLASGTNLYVPNTDGQGVFTYTVGGDDVCEPSQSTVTVNFILTPISGDFTGIQNACITETTFDLFDLLDGTQDTFGVWLNGQGQIISNIINPSLFPLGIQSFVYLVSNSCQSSSTIVQINIAPIPTLTNDDISITNPICQGNDASIFISSLPNGNYSIVLSATGNNEFQNETFNFTVTDGEGLLVVPSSFISNIGSTIFELISITNTDTGCESDLEDLFLTIEILPSPVLNLNSVSVNSPICVGDEVFLTIENATSLTDGLYSFQIIIPELNNLVVEVNNIEITNGEGLIALPVDLFTISGTFNMQIVSILNQETQCSSEINIPLELIVNDVPNVAGLLLEFENNVICLNGTNVAIISNANNLPDGSYMISFTLSGAVSFEGQVSISLVNGQATIDFDEIVFNNFGTVTMTITSVLDELNECGEAITTITSSFEVQEVAPPSIQNLVPFCSEDIPTLNTLSDVLVFNGQLNWFASESDENPLALDTILVNGQTYFASVTSLEECVSVRIPVQVIVEDCLNLGLLIPDGFSPNNDGVNDTFEILNLRDLYPNFELEIYNRYGALVYKGDFNTPDWNGKTNQKGIKLENGFLSNGVYFYVLYFNDGILKPKQGRVYLNR